MEILDNSGIGSEQSSSLTSVMKGYLTETAKWGKFLSIVSFVFIGIIVILAFSIGTIFSKFAGQPGMEAFGAAGSFGAFFTVTYLLLALLMFFPAFYLFKFSTGILKGIPSMDTDGIENALANLKSTFKFYGIMTLIFVGFYALVLVIALIGGLIALA